MQSSAKTPKEYVDSLPEDHWQALSELRKVIRKNLPKGIFQSHGVWHVGVRIPHSMYQDGYPVDPVQPLVLWLLLHKRTLSQSITWAFTPIKNYWLGSLRNIRSMPVASWIWARVVSGLRRWTRFLISSSVCSPQGLLRSNGSKLMKSKSKGSF